MRFVEKNNLFDGGQFVINKNFQVEVAQKIKINLVVVVPDGHNKRAPLVQDSDLATQ